MRTNRRYWPSAILLILALAALLRLISLGDHSLWYDEAFSVLFARNDLATMMTGTQQAVEHPLLYYVTLNAWMQLFGQSPIAVRLFSVVTGVLTVYVAYLVGRDLFNQRTGLTVALITTLAPFHIQYSQEARMYSLLALLLLLATYCFIRALQAPPASKAWGWWLAFGVLAGLAMHTQQLAAFYLLALGLAPLLMRRRGLMLRMVAAASLALLIFSPWLLTLPTQLDRFNAQYWITPPTVAQPLFTLRIFLAGGLEVDASASLAMFAGAIFVAVLLLLQTLIYLRKPRRKADSDRDAVLLLWWLFAAPVALMWLFSQVVPVYLERALLPSALILYLLLGWLFTRAELPRLIALLIGSITLMVAGLGIVAQYRLNSFPYSPVHDLMAHISANTANPETSVVLHMNKLSALPADVYAPYLQNRYLADAPGTPEDTLAASTQQVIGMVADACVAEAVRDTSLESVWLVVYERAQAQYAATGRRELDEAFAYLNAHFQQNSTQLFNDVHAYQYVNPAAQRPTTCN